MCSKSCCSPSPFRAALLTQVLRANHFCSNPCCSPSPCLAALLTQVLRANHFCVQNPAALLLPVALHFWHKSFVPITFVFKTLLLSFSLLCCTLDTSPLCQSLSFKPLLLSFSLSCCTFDTSPSCQSLLCSKLCCSPSPCCAALYLKALCEIRFCLHRCCHQHQLSSSLSIVKSMLFQPHKRIAHHGHGAFGWHSPTKPCAPSYKPQVIVSIHVSNSVCTHL